MSDTFGGDSQASSALPVNSHTEAGKGGKPVSKSPSIDNDQAAAVAQVMQKYSDERAKRLRPEGNAQYVDLITSEKFKHFQDDPWVEDDENYLEAYKFNDRCECKYLILGAGFGGLLFAVRLVQAGISVNDIRLVDSAGGFGGTWYWNRYPGLMCDVESYIYMPLLEETGYMPTHKYAYGPELREHANRIAQKWHLVDRAIFSTHIKSMTWDDSAKEWRLSMVSMRSGHEKKEITVRSQFVISTSGLLNWPKLPNIPGINDFSGHSFHTSRWDYKYTGGSPTDPSLELLKDKRVGIIGTGATAVQAIPHLAKWSKELYVFQRTPSSVDWRGQSLTEDEWWNRHIRGKKGWQRERMENFNAHLSRVSPPPPVNMVADGWTNMPSYKGLIGGPPMVTPESVPEFLASLHAADYPHQETIRRRVDEVVRDPATAENLKPWFPSWCKRPCFHDDYLPVFNLPSVTLIDTDGKGVDRLNSKGVVFNDKEYELDLLIWSTGFRSPGIGSPATRGTMTITGRDGKSLEQKWSEGVGTLHGVTSRGFPNLFFPGPNQAAATANQVFVLEQLSRHVSYMLSEASRRINPGARFTIEPTAEAEEEWAMQVLYRAAAFAGLHGCTPGYLNLEGQIDKIATLGQEEQMKAARASIWGEGVASYVAAIEGWRAEGALKGLEITVA